METTQDEQNQRGSTTSSGGGGGNGGGRSSKKVKPKRIPQRGLGVAQLERIRLEEQQKKDSSIVNNIPSSPSSPITTFPSSESLTNFHHNQSSSSSLIPFSPRRLIDIPSDDSLFKQPPISSPSVDKYPSNSIIPIANQINGGATYEIGWPPLSGYGNACKVWSSEQGQVGEDQTVDHQLAFRPSFSSESNHVASRLNVMRSNHHYPVPLLPSPSMANVSTATSLPSIPSYQMEPPSNQSYHGNYSYLRQEEEKMDGLNISYSFPLEIPPCPSFHYNFPPFGGPIIRSGKSTPCDNGSTRSFYPSSIFFREAPSCSTHVSYPKDIIESRCLNGDFLTLAPPTTTAPECKSNATLNHNSAYSSSCNQNLFEFELLPYKVPVQDPVHHHQPSGSFQPMYSFLPPARTQNSPPRTVWNNVNGARDNIDLNLKL